MWLSFTVVSAPSRTHSYGPCFSVLPSALLFSLLLLSSACVKSVHSVSNDNFYIVRANDAQTKDRPHPAKSHPQASSKNELLQGSKAVKAKTKTNITNPDVLEQKHPVVASLLEKIQHDPSNPQNHYELALVYHRLQI